MTNALASMFSHLQEASDAAAPSAAGGAVGGIVGLLVAVVMVAAMWKVFTKAGQPGWASLVPLYNFLVMLKIIGKPSWYIVLAFVPLANFYLFITLAFGMAKAFGKSTGFGVGLLLLGPVFYPMLAFGDATYQGPDGKSLPPGVPVPA